MYFYSQSEAAIVDLNSGNYLSKEVYLLKGNANSSWHLDCPFFYRDKYLVGFSSKAVTLFFLNDRDIDLVNLPTLPISEVKAVAFANGWLYVGGSSWEIANQTSPIHNNSDADFDSEEGHVPSRYLGPSICRISLDDPKSIWEYLIIEADDLSYRGKAVDCFAVSFDERHIVAVDNMVHPNIDFLLSTEAALHDAIIGRETRYLYSHNRSHRARYLDDNQYAVLATGSHSAGNVQGIATFSFSDLKDDQGFYVPDVQEHMYMPYYSSEMNNLEWRDFAATEDFLYIITRSKALIGIHQNDSDLPVSYVPLASIMNRECRLEATDGSSETDWLSSAGRSQDAISAEQEAALMELRHKFKDELANDDYYNFATERRKIFGEKLIQSSFGEHGVCIRYETYESYPLNCVRDEQIEFHPRSKKDEGLRLVYASSSGIYIDDLS